MKVVAVGSDLVRDRSAGDISDMVAHPWTVFYLMNIRVDYRMAQGAHGALIATALSLFDWSVQERPPLFRRPMAGASPKNLLHGRALWVPIRGAFIGRTRL